MSTYTPIASVTLSSTQSSVTFGGIPQTYTDLVYVIYNKSGGINSSIRFNGDGGSNYSLTQLYGNGSAAASLRSSNVTYGISGVIGNDATVVGHIMNYSNTTTNKTLIARGNAAGDTYIDACVTLWRSTSAITSITFYQNSGAINWASGSTFTLYGVANASITNVAKATGGEIVVTDGNYWYHVFRSSGIFAPTRPITADCLVVAGGGAGMIGGGGAGGLLAHTSQSLNAQNYSVTVGAGGTAQTNSVTTASQGSNSQLGSLTASVGGGAGGLNDNNTSPTSLLNGGSGGGGGGSNSITTPSGSGTSGQGNSGASNGAITGGGVPGGGGGGAGAAGSTPANNTSGGNGGIGATSALINAIGAATGAGQLSGGNYYFAGGGGGGGNGVSTFGQGGLGGGSNASNVPVTNATANTGGGGGGCNGGVNKGGNGGSGIVIVRYAV